MKKINDMVRYRMIRAKIKAELTAELRRDYITADRVEEIEFLLKRL